MATSWGTGRKVTITIASSGTTSDVLDTQSGTRRSGYRMGILTPAALTGTITIEVADVEAGPFKTLQSDGADITLPADKACVLHPFPFQFMRFFSDASEGAQRDFIVNASAE